MLDFDASQTIILNLIEFQGICLSMLSEQEPKILFSSEISQLTM